MNERMKLEIQLHKSTENYEKLDRRMRQQEEDAKRKAEEIIDLKGKVIRTIIWNGSLPLLYFGYFTVVLSCVVVSHIWQIHGLKVSILGTQSPKYLLFSLHTHRTVDLTK